MSNVASRKRRGWEILESWREEERGRRLELGEMFAESVPNTMKAFAVIKFPNCFFHTLLMIVINI